MQKIKSISINTDPNANILHPLVSAHMVPNTDNRFMLEFDEQKFIFLRTIKTGARQILIQGSPNCYAEQIPCAFFLKCEIGYELHFCTKRRDKGSTIVCWYRWNLNQDFFDILSTYGRLPLQMNVKNLMDNMKERDDYKQ